MRPRAILLLAILGPSSLAKVTGGCVQFSTDGPTAAKYDFYRFYDFRNLNNSDNAPAFTASAERFKEYSIVPWKAGWDASFRLSSASETHGVDLQYTPSELFIS